jgi:hypothetical protein
MIPNEMWNDLGVANSKRVYNTQVIPTDLSSSFLSSFTTSKARDREEQRRDVDTFNLESIIQYHSFV